MLETIYRIVVIVLLVLLVWNSHQALKRMHRIMSGLDDLKAAVAAEDTAIGKAVTLLQAIPGLIAAAQGADNPDAELEALATHVESETASIQGGLQASGQEEQPPAPAALAVTTTSLADATIGTGYTASIAVEGGTAPYSVSVSGLPDGLVADATGAISGTPTTAGSSTVTVSVSDSATPSPNTASTTLTLNVDAAAGG